MEYNITDNVKVIFSKPINLKNPPTDLYFLKGKIRTYFCDVNPFKKVLIDERVLAKHPGVLAFHTSHFYKNVTSNVYVVWEISNPDVSFYKMFSSPQMKAVGIFPGCNWFDPKRLWFPFDVQAKVPVTNIKCRTCDTPLVEVKGKTTCANCDTNFWINLDFQPDKSKDRRVPTTQDLINQFSINRRLFCNRCSTKQEFNKCNHIIDPDIKLKLERAFFDANRDEKMEALCESYPKNF